MTGTSPEVPQRRQETPSPQAELSERQRRSDEHVESVEERNKRLVAMRSKNKETLCQNWLQNKNKAEKREVSEDPRYLALRDIPAKMGEIKNEAAGLLHLYEKFLGTRQQALELYKKCWKNDKFDIDVLRKEFSREKTLGKTGFYYGTRKIYWDWSRGVTTTASEIEKRIKDAGFTGTTKEHARAGAWKTKLVTIKGWWAHDINEDNEKYNFVSGGNDVEKDLLKKLSDDGCGDEWLGKKFNKAINVNNPAFKTELNPTATNRDNQLDPDKEQEVVTEVTKAMALNTATIYKAKEKQELYKYFTVQAANKWFSLSGDKVGSMNFAFGKDGVHPQNYMYRYCPEKKRIYFVRIEGAGVSDSEFGGYIEIDDAATTKTLKEWKAFNKQDAEKELKELIDSMKDEDMVKELIDYGQKVEGVNLLDRTKGMVTSTEAFKKGIAHDKLGTDFYDVVRKKLHSELEKQGIAVKEDREKYVEPRIDDLKKQLDKAIEGNSLIQEGLKDNRAVKISIGITDDIVKVDIAEEFKTKYQTVLDTAKAAKDSVEEKAKGIFGQVETKVKKMFGKASGIVMMILNKVFKFDTESIGKSLSGSKEKGVAMTGFILGLFGIKKGAAMFGGEKLDQKGMDGIIESGKKEKVLGKETAVSESVKLTGKKIVIPKGKGIQPGGKLKVKMDGRDVEIDKKEAEQEKPGEKAKKGLFGLFGGGGGEEEENVQLTDNEIVIENGAVIPKDTVIPKGAKVIKV